MFDVDAGKLIVIGIVALVVIGPKELPRVLRQVGAAVGKMRRMASEFQEQFNEALKESEVADIKKEMAGIADQARVDMDYNPVADTEHQIRSAIEGEPVSAAAGTPNPAPGADPDNAFIDVDIPATAGEGAAPQGTATGPVTADAAEQSAQPTTRPAANAQPAAKTDKPGEA